MKKAKTNEEYLREAKDSRFRELNKIGTSKKQARDEYNEWRKEEVRKNGKPIPTDYAPSPYIHGLGTLKQYNAISEHYITYIVENHPEAYKLSYCFKHGFAHEYIQTLIDKGQSAWSIARARAALAKLHGKTGPEIHNDIPRREAEDITKGRMSELEYAAALNEYGDMVAFARCVGVRSATFVTLTPDCFKTDNEGNLFLHLDGKLNNTKGGENLRCRNYSDKSEVRQRLYFEA